jgi:ABC-2 type transport system ATP-binding protein
MTAPLEAEDLGKRFHRRWALRRCTLTVPEGAIVGLAGANGAGKSTLLGLATGLLAPTEGRIGVLGRDPRADPGALAEIGYVAQGAPLYTSFTVGDTIEFARRTNPNWDAAIAGEFLGRLRPSARVGSLSFGQRSRLALALALGKRPRVVLLDEPFARLDPLAGREFLQLLMDGAAATSSTVVVASHVVSDIERVCDHIVLLADGCVRLQGDVEAILDSHRLVTGPRRPLGTIRGVREIVRERHSGRQLTLLVRGEGPVGDPSWTVDSVGLEELLLAYMAPEPLTSRPARREAPAEVPVPWHG